MATPTFSISVPEDEKEAVRHALPDLITFAGVDGTPASLSGLVRQMIINGARLEINGLNQSKSFQFNNSLERRVLQFIRLAMKRNTSIGN